MINIDNPVIVRLNSDGTIDTTYGVNGQTAAPFDLNQEGNFNYLGTTVDSNGNSYSYVKQAFIKGIQIAKINQNGVVDNTFGIVNINHPTGYNPTLDIENLEVIKLNSGKLLITYLLADYDNSLFNRYIVKFNTDGTIDTSFADNGYYAFFTNDVSVYSTVDRIYNLKEANNGKIYFYTHNADHSVKLTRLIANGTIDTTFCNNGELEVLAANIDPHPTIYERVEEMDNGSLLLTSTTMNVNGVYTTVQIELRDSSGVLDPLFADAGVLTLDTPVLYRYVNQTKLLQSGKILILEERVRLNSSSTITRLLRINQDGSIDTSFGTNGYFVFPFYANFVTLTRIDIDTNNKILIYGNHNGNYTGFSENIDTGLIIRLNSNGTLDTTFGRLSPVASNNFKEIEIGTNIVLCPEIDIKDNQLSNLNNGLGNFNGASFNVSRTLNAGDYNDEFTFINNVTTDGNVIKVDNIPVAIFTTTVGVLNVTFNTDLATTDVVNTVLRNLSYKYNDVLYPDVYLWSINITFNDGNSGSQGLDGSMDIVTNVFITFKYGTLLSVQCQGTDKIGLFTDGLGATFTEITEYDSVYCGFDPYVYPSVNVIPQPTVWVNTSEAEGVVVSNQGRSVAGIPSNTLIKADAVITSGKWYWEITCTANNLLEYITPIIGVSMASASLNLTPPLFNKWLYDDENGLIIQDTSTFTLEFFNFLNSDTYVFGIGLDMNAGTLRIYTNIGYQIAIFSGIDTNKAVSPTIGNSTLSQLGVVTANFGLTPFVNSPPNEYRGLNDLLFVHDSFTESSKVNLLAHQTNTGQSWVKGTSALDAFTNLDLNIEVNTDGTTSVEEYDHYDELGVTEPYSTANNKLSDAWLNYLIPSYNYYIEALVEVLPDANDSYFTIYARVQNLIDDGDYIDLNWWPSPSWASGRSTINESNWGSGINNPTPTDVGAAYPPGQYLIRLVLEANVCKLYIDNIHKGNLILTGAVVTNASNGGYCGFGIFPKTTNLNGQGIKLLDYKVYNLYIPPEI